MATANFLRKFTRLEKALRQLVPDQGRAARRKARRKVLAALVALRRQVDRLYPLESKARRKFSAKPEARLRRLKRSGWVAFDPTRDNLLHLASATINIKKHGWGSYLCPAWAAFVLENAKEDVAMTLRTLKYSAKARAAFMVAHVLENDLDEK